MLTKKNWFGVHGGNWHGWRKNVRTSLLAALLLSSLAGCGGGDEGGSSTDPSSPTQSPVDKVSAVDGYGVVRPGTTTRVDLSAFVRGSGAALSAMSSEQPGCTAGNLSGLSAEVTNDSGLCEFTYQVSNSSSNATAAINVLASSATSPLLPPLSQTMLLGTGNATYDLQVLLGADWPAGYSLDPASVDVQGGTVQGSATASGNTLTYTPPSTPDWNRIVFILKNPAKPDEDALGTLYVTVSDSINQPPQVGAPKYDYQVQTGGSVVPHQTLTLDLGTLPNLNITDPDSQEWQLIEVQSYSASVVPVDPISVTNKQFTFTAGLMGEHIVSYIVGDHEGGFASGLIKIVVGPDERPKTWDDILIGSILYQATPLYSEVIARSVIAEGVWDSGVNNTIGGVSDLGASAYCHNGNHLATKAELDTLRTTPAADVERNKYPVQRTYVVSDGASGYLTYDLANGTTAPYVAGTTPGQYVICVSTFIVTQLDITPVDTQIQEGSTQRYIALATLDNGDQIDVSNKVGLTWWSSDWNVATIVSGNIVDGIPRDNGVATGIDPGTATIGAEGWINGTPFVATAQLKVLLKQTVTKLDVTPTTASVSLLHTRAFTAEATLNDGTVRDVTNSPDVSWSSSDPNIATIVTGNAVNGNFTGNGVATGVNPGVVTITASGVDPDGTSFTARARLTVIDVEGTVVTWGDPNSGGDSAAIQDELTRVVDIFSSQGAFAALKYDGTVVAWGDPAAGGNSSTVESQLTDVKDIFSNSAAFAALKQDGSVVTWGDPIGGGNSSAVESKLTSVSKVASTASAFAALKTNGSVVTWGNPAGGGDSSAVSSQLASNVKAVYSQIWDTAGAFAALKNDGTVVTWGDPDAGGDSSAVESQLTDVQTITSTGRAFAALKQDGTVVTWGYPAGGDSTRVESQLVNVKAIFATGYAFAALRQDGTVVSWGNSAEGGDSSSVQEHLTNIQTIISTRQSFAALRQDGNVYDWGQTEYYIRPSQPLTNILAVTPSGGAFAALKQDGTVVAWGASNSGGDDSAVQSQLTDIQAVYGSSITSAFAAVKQDGSVVTWGYESWGGDSSSVQDQLFSVKEIFWTSNAFAALRQ